MKNNLVTHDTIIWLIIAGGKQIIITGDFEFQYSITDYDLIYDSLRV